MKHKYSVLFVCTANIIRSSMAAAFFRKMLIEYGTIDLWQIESAGTWAKNGQKVPHEVIGLMKERGLDLEGHRSRLVTGEILNKFSLILTMTAGQKEALKIEFPGIAGNVFMLGEMSGNGAAISDPSGEIMEEYQRTADDIERFLVSGKERITELAMKKPHEL